ncbi:Mycolysin precursor [compost metagenome]
MHEMGHYYMYNLYGSIPPIPSCSNHTFQTATSTGCAWVEGWASIVPLIFSNGVYTYTSGATISLENTSSFDNGDTVEGRVLGALWDLYDTANDGTDTRSYDFSKIYRAMWDGGSKSTFANWWSKWKSLNYDVDAKFSIQQNAINYN